MRAIFYKNLSDNRQIRKNLTQIGSVSCEIKDMSSLHNPTIIISKDAYSDISRCNYMYVDTFARYYFINDVKISTAGLVEIKTTVDALQSFANEILALKCVIDRQENLYSKLIVDSNAPVRVNRTISYRKVGAFPFSKSIVLTVDGGKQ